MNSSQKAAPPPHDIAIVSLQGARGDDVAVNVRPQAQSPVLPPGWAPLTRDQQAAVLQACDRAPGALAFRVDGVNLEAEYRVYRLDEGWAGLCVASIFAASSDGRPAGNRELIALAPTADQAIALVLSRVNAEKRAAGGRLQVALSTPAVLPEDPRRV